MTIDNVADWVVNRAMAEVGPNECLDVYCREVARFIGDIACRRIADAYRTNAVA
jgi:hypothetical protein